MALVSCFTTYLRVRVQNEIIISDSILVNKNMKLLILLVTLLVLLANPSLSKPTPNLNFKEIKNNLREMQDAVDGLKQHELEPLKVSKYFLHYGKGERRHVILPYLSYLL